MEPPPILLIKSKHDDKSDKDFVNIKLCTDPKSEKSDLYEFKMALFDNNDKEEFFLFAQNFNMNLEASGTLQADAKIQYLCMHVQEEALRQFGTFSSHVESITPLKLEAII